MARITPPDTDRLALLRDICGREGHGELLEATSINDLGKSQRVYICQRGCQSLIYQFRQGKTASELAEAFPGATIYVREVTVVPKDSP